MRTILTATLGLSLAFAATAQAQAQAQAQSRNTPGTVPYYITHNAERQAMERQCGMTTGWPSRCQAAQKAADYLRLAALKQRVQAGEAGPGSIYSPAYYDRWPLARQLVLQQCAHPVSEYGPTPRACQAARISAGQ